MIKSIPQGTKCPAIDGIIAEANEIAGEIEDKIVLNAALIAAAQAVEHYEITCYGTLVAWAKVIGRNDVAKILNMTLSEEKATDKKLGGIAKRKINRRAATRKLPKPDRSERAEKRHAECGGWHSRDLARSLKERTRVNCCRISFLLDVAISSARRRQ